MRKALGLSIFITSLFAGAPAFAQDADPEWTFDAGVEVASALAYTDQAEIIDSGTTFIVDGEACRGDWCFSVWHAETGDEATRETDILVTRSFMAGPFAIDLTGGAYLVKGPEIWTGIAAVTYPVSDSLSLTVSHERMRGGFETDVTKVATAYETEVNDHVLVDIGASYGFDTFIDDTVATAEVGVSYAVTEAIAIRAYAIAFTSDYNDGTVVGLSLRRSW